MIKQIASEVDKPVLLLDAGALLFDQPVVPSSLLPARIIQASGVSQSMQAMNYAAIGAAPQDLAAGMEFFVQQHQEHNLPWISANLTNTAGARPLQPYVMTKLDDTSVAIIGLTGPPAGNPPGESSGVSYRILPWQEVVADILNRVKGHAEMIILLSSYPESINREIAERFSDIHLIIQSGNSSVNKGPQLVGNTLITQVAGRGKYLGRLDIKWNTTHRWNQDVSPRLQQARDSLDRINWRLGRLEKRPQEGEGLAQNREYQQLRQEKDRLNAEISQSQQLAQENQQELSTFTSTFVPLKVSLPEDPDVQKIVGKTKQEINNVGRKKFEETQQLGQPTTSIAGSGMTGWNTCRSCHPAQTAFWQKSRHAGAWQTLERVKQQFNQDCLLCHVTLPIYDREVVHRENLLATLAQEFQGVGCEACHGPGRKHADAPDQAQPLLPNEKTCLTCHTPEHDNNFNYEQKRRLIRCPASPPNNKGAA